jgi:hypothetical protein
MTTAEISEFEALEGQIESLHQELSTLVKKNPSDLLNKFKLGLINSLLTRSNALLGDQRKPFSDFVQFDTDALPSNSDVLLVIGQYLSALEKLRADNIYQEYDTWYWYHTDASGKKKQSTKQTAPPKRISAK